MIFSSLIAYDLFLSASCENAASECDEVAGC
jgi:hypothetical protein